MSVPKLYNSALVRWILKETVWPAKADSSGVVAQATGRRTPSLVIGIQSARAKPRVGVPAESRISTRAWPPETSTLR
jgi:hypothetical protein